MKVTLTGATGFIGSHVLTELQQHGHEVTALVRDDGQAESNDDNDTGDSSPPRLQSLELVVLCAHRPPTSSDSVSSSRSLSSSSASSRLRADRRRING